MSANGRGRPKGALNRKTREMLEAQIAALPVEASTQETEEQIAARISRTFNVLGKVTQSVIKGTTKAMTVSGAPGCGKTYEIERALTKAAESGLIEYNHIKGVMSPVHLFKELYRCSQPGHILVLDDCDSVFDDGEALNPLKAALDTTKTRYISWNKESRVLENEGVPTRFNFEGACIFITNIDFRAAIAKGYKIAPHLQALTDRSLYIDLGIHSKREILVRIKEVLTNTDFFSDHQFTSVQGKLILDYLENNFAQISELSIRTAVKLGGIMKTHRVEWKDVAEVTLLKR